ncbi:MAG: 4-hydroxy-tetrahydrodipicolinate synthase [Alphaproteobacteria bacterium]
MFKGAITALITPFKDDATIDFDALAKIIEWQIAEGIEGLVPCGTTGESPTLSSEEQIAVIKTCVEVTRKRVPVIAGTGFNSTKKTIEMTAMAKDAGVDACLVVCPYYNKPSQDNLYHHFSDVAKTNIPIIIYNIPSRTGVDLMPETVTKLAKNITNIIGIKDATANLERPLKTRILAGSDFCQLSGEDATAAAFLAQGGHGCISVTANVAPKMCSDMQKFWQQGKFLECFNLRDKLMPLHEAMFVESNPGPVKYAASLLGICSGISRAPLYGISEASKAKIAQIMKNIGILS